MAEPIINSTHVLLNPMDLGTEFTFNSGQVRGAGGSIVTIYGVFTNAGGGWNPVNDGVRIQANGAATSTTLLGWLLNDGNELDQADPENAVVDGSLAAGDGKRLFYTHHHCTQAQAITDTEFIVNEGTGWMFALFSDNGPSHDRTTDVRVWCGGGADTIPIHMQPSPTSFIAVDPTHTDSEVPVGVGLVIDTGTAGTFDPTAIISAGWVHRAVNTDSDLYQNATRFGYYDAYTILEGDAATPGTFQDFLDIAYDENHYAMAIGGFTQFRSRMALEFGDRSLANTQPTYFKVENISIEFERAISDTNVSLIRVLHAAPNKIGMEEKLRSGDTWIATNCTFTSDTAWHWRFASTLGADVQYNNCIISNAGGTDDDCEIGADVVINGGLITGCGKVSINAGEIKNLTVSEPESDAAVAITETSTLSDVVFSVVNPAGKHAIEIPDPASGTDDYTFNDLTFTGFEFDVRVLGTTGTVNITVNGGSTPVISKGTVLPEDVSLLGAGWVDGTSYTAVTGGGDTKRMVAVVVSNDGSKLPTGVTFGGEAMTLAISQLQDSIGLSMWYLMETGSSVFSGSQTIAGTYTAGDPTNITFQSATYDHVTQTQTIETVSSGNSAGPATVTNLDDWQSARAALVSFSVSAGANRLLIVIVNHEDNGGSPGASGVTWGGQSLTSAVARQDAQSHSEIWYLNESGIAAATGDLISINGTVGDTPDYGAASFVNVDQTTPIRDTASDIDANPSSGATMTINDTDMILASFTSTSGFNLTSWNNLMATPDSSFADGQADDPSHGAYKSYSGSDVTTGTISASGGDARTAFCCVTIANTPFIAGDLDVTVPNTRDGGLVLAAAQMSSVQNLVWDGDATARDEVDRSNETVGVADYIETTDNGTANMGFTNTDATDGVDSQIIAAHFQTTFSQTGGPTVNILTPAVTTTITALEVDGTPVENARVLLEAAAGGPLSEGTDIIDGLTNASGVITDVRSLASNQPVVGRVRKSTDPGSLFQTANIVSRTIDNILGLSITVVMIPDE